ncbi:hypothetical protein L1D52_04175 [Vibrio brasiliensis]|uniref:hypothetical protein n=1 Tax=Vibrio brasiliensis TaxID=170652 RepID=UPI001EFDC960|nr:hypothetical protein [Vibrio brasiliensis]MCG9781538.1 hypothetical protein [Vibrio brasiliensis]
MTKLLFLVVMVFTYIPALTVHAAQYNMVIKNQELEQDSFVTDGGSYIPSIWDTPFSVPTTSLWSPKLPVERTSTVKLISGQEEIEIEVTVMGFEYHVGSSSQSVSQEVTSSCLNGSIISVARGKCEQQSLSYSLQTNEAPFVLIRPVIRFDRDTVVRTMNGKPDGIYSGSVLVESTFDYYWGDVKARRVIPINVEFVVINRTDKLTSVSVVSGNGQFFNRFSSDSTEISGNTTYGVNVAGKFSSGIKLSLASARNSYALTNTRDESSIPYTVRCNTCNDKIIVDTGRVTKQSTTISNDFSRSIDFNLEFSYSNVSTSALTSGDYTDSFYLFVEVDI